MSKAIFAGTFDPFTIGHYDIASRASSLFDEVVIGVASVSSLRLKKTDLNQRFEIASVSVADLKNVSVKTFDGFLTDFAEREGAKVLIRGLRTFADFEYEKSLSQVYKSQNKKIECLYLISSQECGHVSGSVVRELAALGGKLDKYVCKAALGLVEKIYKVK